MLHVFMKVNNVLVVLIKNEKRFVEVWESKIKPNNIWNICVKITNDISHNVKINQ